MAHTFIPMPSITRSDAFHTPMGGIPYCRGRHLHHSWKASERPVEGIPINGPLVLLCRGGKTVAQISKSRQERWTV
ncbi:MAG: hypothetical protein K6E15_03595 [Prevotella sp.]|nr:hypothetical protein [Prevotella sp.]